MVGRVLTRNGITRCERGTYALVGVYELSDAERDQLQALCRQRLDVGRRSVGAEEFIHSQADVLGDLTEQRWRDIGSCIQPPEDQQGDEYSKQSSEPK